MQPICGDYFEEAAATGAAGLALNAPVRAYLTAVKEYLLGKHQAGASASRLNEERAELMDRLVRRLFRAAEDVYFERFPRLNYRIALVAVGGYGRRELSLASDLDLLFLHQGKINPYVETIAETLTQRLWDARCQVAPSTRTLTDCLRVAQSDLATLTSLLDARFLIGAPELFAELEQAVREWIRRDAASFAARKLEEQRERHARYGESLYLLQPHLREAVGGLRDWHTALWVARAVHWDARTLRDLHVHGFLDEQQRAELGAALEFLWRARNELHRGGRKDDRLHYAAQERLAALLLPTESALELTPVERLMQAYYVHARTVERVTRHIVQHALGVLERRGGRRAEAPCALAEGFLLADGQLEIPSEQLLRERPARMLAAFSVAQQHDCELSVRAQRALRQCVELVDDAFRADAECAALFLRVLGSPRRVYRSLKLMDELGLLAAYLPEFRHLVGLWQQDLYHTYTVDVHSLFLVEQLRRMRGGRYREELPLATALMRELRAPGPLFLACILHDIGKGRGGNHSEKGAAQVPAICARLGLEADDSALVEMLVRHHLTMSAMAERRDVDDPRVILRLASLAPSREWLRHLYLLTVADVRSVSQEAWTTWKAGLLERLYRNAAEWFEAGESGANADEFFIERAAARVAARQQEVLAGLAGVPGTAERATELLNAMPRRYLLDHETADIVAQVQAGLRFLQGGTPAAAFTYTSGAGGGFWGVVVFAHDRHGLFSTVAGAISSLGHDILGAQVYTARTSLAMEIFQLAPAAGGAEEEDLERERIEQRVRAALGGEALPRRAPPAGGAPSSRRQPPEVIFANEDSDFYTVIDVHANDRPGLLHDVTRALAEFDVNVVMARVATRAQDVSDAFYVTLDGGKIGDAEQQEKLRAALLEAVRGAQP